MEHLQKLINEKAEKRLDSEIQRLSEMIRASRLISITENGTIPDINGQKPYWSLGASEDFFKGVKKYWLPIYQKEEAAEFVAKVERLNNDVINLMNNNYNEE